jgi:hypothetical protein
VSLCLPGADQAQLLPSVRSITAVWAEWMTWAIPRMRSAVLATRPIRPFPHQDDAVFGAMLSQPRLRFLLAGEPCTAKTLMTGMYLAEGRRRGLVPGKTVIVVPAHLVRSGSGNFGGSSGSRPTASPPRSAEIPSTSATTSTSGLSRSICTPTTVTSGARLPAAAPRGP